MRRRKRGGQHARHHATHPKPGCRAGLSRFRRPHMTDRILTPTLIQEPIPVADMTPLERLVLSLIFTAEPHGDALRFHTACGPRDMIRLSASTFWPAVAASAAVDSTTTGYIAERL